MGWLRAAEQDGREACSSAQVKVLRPGNRWLRADSRCILSPLSQFQGEQSIFREGVKMRKTTWMFLAAFLCLSGWTTYAQEVSAGITGRVTDPSGSAIVGAAVTAKDQDRGTEWPTTTNEDGIYAFPRIPVGTYSLKIEAKGFKVSMQAALTLEV